MKTCKENKLLNEQQHPSKKEQTQNILQQKKGMDLVLFELPAHQINSE
jgi:hypothetical protein